VLAEQAGFKPAALAKQLKVSLRVLELFFRARTGGCVRKWLNEARLRTAALRLLAGLGIKDVASELAYCHASNFYRQFRGFFRQTPGEFVAERKPPFGRAVAQDGPGPSMNSAGRKLAEALRETEALLRVGGCAYALGQRPVRIILVSEDPKVQSTLQEALDVLRPGWRLELRRPAKELVKDLAKEPPAVVLLDCEKPQDYRFDSLRLLTTCLPSLPVIVFAASSDGTEILSALARGAVGYVLKTAPPFQLVEAIKEVLKEGAFLCQQAKQVILEFIHGGTDRQGKSKLTSREREVCVLIVLYSRKEVAAKLNIEIKTVDALAHRAFKKLGVSKRGELLGALLRLS
jgi:DNA-binding NarL/FixJ family response regulator/AraC-like DNA-binding protein